MKEPFGYGHTLRANDQYFGRGVAMPQNADGVECDAALRVGSHLGSLALCVAAADDAVSLAADKSLTVKLLTSAGQDGPFEEKNLAYAVKNCSGQALGAEEGDILARFILPDCKQWVKIRLASDDAAAAGTVDVFLSYVAR